MPDTAAVKAELEARRTELEARLANLTEDLAEPIDPDFSEAAVQKEDDAALEGQAEVVTRGLASINRALERLAAGTYGECVHCGVQIAEGRLRARPEAALCISCANKL